MTELRGKTILGTFCHAPIRGEIEILSSTLVQIGKDGVIAAVVRADDPGFAAARQAAQNGGKLVEIPPGQFVLPGFVDCHVHAPQYPQLGKALNVPLEVWLYQHTFPLEARYADANFARRVYDVLVRDLLSLGTTTALYFATLHQEATRMLADCCLAHGQRALVGKVAMDHPDECPDFYRDASPADGIAGTAALIDYIGGHASNDGLVHPVVTPRFIPSCTDELLEGLGKIAQECGCHVQTHASESDWAHGYALGRYGRTDATMLDEFGLLTRRTALAHANFLTPDDMARVAARGAGVAHCPVSNAYFANSVFPLRDALEKGVHVGLGTDISGGPIASMLDAQRMAVAASRMLETGVDPSLPAERRGRPGARFDFELAFHLATAGGGEMLDLPVGLFRSGHHFDALRIDPAAPDGTMRVFDDLDDPADIVQKILYTASKPNLAEVWVGGRSVAGAA